MGLLRGALVRFRRWLPRKVGVFTRGVLPDHESGVRRMVSDSRGEAYRAFRTLAEAQGVSDGVVVMEGDYGGQIYLTCPARLVNCDQATLERLLRDLDRLGWKDPETSRVFFERGSPGSGVWGGMGGGLIVEGVWLHPELQKLGIEERVRDVIAGTRRKLT